MLWFDLDNSPHVPLFNPILLELSKRQIDYLVTARDFAQTRELLQLCNIDYTLIGGHGGKNKVKKIANLFYRAHQLKKVIKEKHISLSISHGSRTQLVATKMKAIKSLLMFDYEYTESKIFNMLSTFMLAPKFIPEKRLIEAGFNTKKLIRYNGFKEELYLSQFKPITNFRKQIDVEEDQLLVVLRPPSMVGNYHDSKSEKLLIGVINHFLSDKSVAILVVNRTKTEKDFLLHHFKISERLRFLSKAIDGLQLLFASDYTISGGGTMNRESALLGTKTYSIFSGRRPYLDEYLQDLNRLTFIESTADIKRIEIRRHIKSDILLHSNALVDEVTDIIIDLSKKSN